MYCSVVTFDVSLAPCTYRHNPRIQRYSGWQLLYQGSFSIQSLSQQRQRPVELLDVVLPFPQQFRFIKEALGVGLAVVPLGAFRDNTLIRLCILYCILFVIVSVLSWWQWQWFVDVFVISSTRMWCRDIVTWCHMRYVLTSFEVSIRYFCSIAAYPTFQPLAKAIESHKHWIPISIWSVEIRLFCSSFAKTTSSRSEKPIASNSSEAETLMAGRFSPSGRWWVAENWRFPSRDSGLTWELHLTRDVWWPIK